MKLLIFGASGSGTTTLGRELGEAIHCIHLDSDDYYWKQTEPPYQEKNPFTERVRHLTTDVEKHQNVIVSGSLVSWGPYWHTAFDLAVFLYLPPLIRMARLEQRESERNKDRPKTLLTESISKEFMDYVKQYDAKQDYLAIIFKALNSLKCGIVIMLFFHFNASLPAPGRFSTEVTGNGRNTCKSLTGIRSRNGRWELLLVLTRESW